MMTITEIIFFIIGKAIKTLKFEKTTNTL